MAKQFNSIPNTVTYRQVAILHGKSLNSALSHIKLLRKIKGKLKHQPLYVAEFCELEGISEQFYRQQLIEAHNNFNNKTA